MSRGWFVGLFLWGAACGAPFSEGGEAPPAAAPVPAALSCATDADCPATACGPCDAGVELTQPPSTECHCDPCPGQKLLCSERKTCVTAYDIPIVAEGAPTPGAGKADLAVNVEVGAWNAVAVEVKCEDVRERATLSNGTAMVKGIPTDEDCTLYFKGGMPVQFHPVRGGQSLTCTFEGATASCK